LQFDTALLSWCGSGAVTVGGAELLVPVGGEDRVDDTVSVVPTQYAKSAQKPVLQSDETAGFHARNCALVMKNSFSTEGHESPAKGGGG
jgi:hypothetical protein